MNVRHILFAETSEQTLQHAMSVLTAAHDDWRIVLVHDADAALDLLSRRNFCTVFANFGRDRETCERLLQAAKELAPAAIRYALLPVQGEAGSTRFPAAAYQCFPTGCKPAEIETAIQRGLVVWQQCCNNPSLTALLADLQNIPTPPTLYFEIREALNAEDCDVTQIAEIISHDPAIASHILKVANSGFYALPRTISTIGEAIVLMGTDTVTSLVLAAHTYDRMPVPGVNLDALWQHSLAVSSLARHIAGEEGGDRMTANTAGVAGLLHDIGQLTLLSNAPELYQSLLRQAGGNENRLIELERERFGVGHAELGSYVLGLWSLPSVVVEAVLQHHDVATAGGPPATLVSKAVCAAERLLTEFTAPDQAGQSDEHDYPLPVTPERIEAWKGYCAGLVR